MNFKVQFSEKTVWREIKADLKTLFKEVGLKYDYSEKTPTFRVVYSSAIVGVEVSWTEQALIFSLIAKEKPQPEAIIILDQIYDLLELFGGEISSGTRPTEW